MENKNITYDRLVQDETITRPNLWLVIKTLNKYVNKYRNDMLDAQHHAKMWRDDEADGTRKRFYNINTKKKETHVKTYNRKCRKAVELRTMILQKLKVEQIFIYVMNYKQQGEYRKVAVCYNFKNESLILYVNKKTLDTLQIDEGLYKDAEYGIKYKKYLKNGERSPEPISPGPGSDEEEVSYLLCRKIAKQISTGVLKIID